jgi:outer membrane protein OmpA-like peptidoglycan-associated protein
LISSSFTSSFFLILLFVSSYAQKDLENITTREELIQYINAIAPDEDAFVALQMLARDYIDNKNWLGAAELFNKYRSFFPEMGDRFDKIISLLKASSQELKAVNLTGVNTGADEYFPTVSIDGTKMYFTGSGQENSRGGEDIFYSEFVGGVWKPAINMGKPFSTKGDDAVNSISADGTMLVIFGNYKGAFGGGDNFYVQKLPGGWSEIKPFPKPVNSEYWDCDGFLTADGKAFLFTSDRKGGVGEFQKGGRFFHGGYEGNTDIYVSLKTDSGWSQPINLGFTINTPYVERSPFLHPDGKTLYFSSDGHYGLGGLDVFKSVRKSDTSWTHWTQPVNLGKEINTGGYDIAYRISTDGKLAYFASNRPGGLGGYDLYAISLPSEVQPEKNVITIKGKVTDEDNNPLDADIRWFDISSNENVGNLKSDPQTGDYIIALPVGKNYGYFAEKNGYYSVSKNVDLLRDPGIKEHTEDIKLISAASLQGKPIKLNNIYFDFDRYDLKPESFTELDRVFKFLTDNPEVRIEISAHTDAVGTDEYNLTLSQRRAESVVNYLIGKGMDAARLTARGYGKSMPVASNETEEGRALNRRVEMKVIK